MARFKVVLERTDTITKYGEMMVEASSAEEARQIILADLELAGRALKKKRVLTGIHARRNTTRAISFTKYKGELSQARQVLEEAHIRFNSALADPRADLIKLELAIRRAEQAVARAGA